MNMLIIVRIEGVEVERHITNSHDEYIKLVTEIVGRYEIISSKGSRYGCIFNVKEETK